MWRKAIVAALVLTVGLTACARNDLATAASDVGRGADTPLKAVEELVGLLNTADFAVASALVVPGQPALASLVEGATFAQVADAIEGGDAAVASNFWAGFAQGAGSFLTGSLTTDAGPVITEAELEFHTVDITLEDGSRRQLLARDVNGYRIDLFASFGGGLADKMIPPVERLISSQTDDASIVLPALKTIVPSLLVAANQPETTPQSVQDLLRLIELITRVS